jgi:hypothetical protein
MSTGHLFWSLLKINSLLAFRDCAEIMVCAVTLCSVILFIITYQEWKKTPFLQNLLHIFLSHVRKQAMVATVDGTSMYFYTCSQQQRVW